MVRNCLCLAEQRVAKAGATQVARPMSVKVDCRIPLLTHALKCPARSVDSTSRDAYRAGVCRCGRSGRSGVRLPVRLVRYVSMLRRKPGRSAAIWLKVVRRGVTIAAASFLVYIGITVIANGAPNHFISAAIAVFCLSAAIGLAGGDRFEPSILRMKWAANAVTASLFAVGAVLEGGPIGILGAILSVFIAAFWGWMLLKIRFTDR